MLPFLFATKRIALSLVLVACLLQLELRDPPEAFFVVHYEDPFSDHARSPCDCGK